MVTTKCAQGAYAVARSSRASIHLGTLMLLMVPIAVVFAAARASMWLAALMLCLFWTAVPRTRSVLATQSQRRGPCSLSDAVEAYLSSLWRVVFVAFLLVASFGIPFVVGVCVAGVIWGAWHNLTAVFVATIFSLIASVGLGPVLFCRMILWVLENYWDAPEEPACAGRWRVPPEPGE